MWTLLLAPALAAPSVEARDAYLAATDQMVQRLEATRAATWTFRKQEFADQARQPRYEMTLKWRSNGDTYLKYVGENHEGREVLYRPEELPEEILVSPSSLLPTMTFDLRGKVATDGERYTVDNLSLHRTAGNFERDGQLLAARDHRGLIVEDLGRRRVAGEAARCFDVALPKAEVPQLYAERVEVCVADRTGVMVSVKAWDTVEGTLQLVEDYVWADLQLAAPLTDADFDPDHDAYRF